MASAWKQLQELVIDEMRENYSEIAIDHAMNPRNVGSMGNAVGFARLTGPCGDTMEIWLKARDATITESTFMTDGCGTTIAAGSMVPDVKGIDEAVKLYLKGKLPNLMEWLHQGLLG